jgi:hypothetical protein
MDFFAKLLKAQQQSQSWIGLRLDVRTRQLPQPLAHTDDPLLPFGQAIVDTTHELVCAYLIDPSDYFAEGAPGMIALERIVRYIPDSIPIVLDCRFGELEASAEGYARGAFDAFRADAVTFSRMPDRSTLEAFLKYSGKCLFVPVNTLIMAQQSLAGCGLLIHTVELAYLQLSAIQLPVLLRDWSASDRHTGRLIGTGNFNPIVDAGPGVIYASSHEDFAEALHVAVDVIRQQVNAFRPTALAAL